MPGVTMGREQLLNFSTAPDLTRCSCHKTVSTGLQYLESVRIDHTGLHSFLSISLMEARRRKASPFRFRHSQSFASLRHRPSQAKGRSTTHRFGKTTKPFAASERLTISTFTRAMIFRGGSGNLNTLDKWSFCLRAA